MLAERQGMLRRPTKRGPFSVEEQLTRIIDLLRCLSICDWTLATLVHPTHGLLSSVLETVPVLKGQTGTKTGTWRKKLSSSL